MIPLIATAAAAGGIETLIPLVCGLIIGAGVMFINRMEKVEAYRQDCENHEYAALELSKKLGHANGKICVLTKQNEDLTEQVNSLLANIDKPEADPAEFWKQEPRDIQFPPAEA